jgi:poly(3-hydroxybutyrate) depolymerase
MDRIARIAFGSALSKASPAGFAVAAMAGMLLTAGACFGQGRPGRPGAPAGSPAGDSGSGGPKYTTKVPGQHEKQGADVSMLQKVFEPRTFTTLDGHTMEYRLMKPAGYTPGKAYPMVVCLHGIPGEGKGNTLQLLASYAVGVLAKPEVQQRHPCFVLAPQSPNWWGNEPYGNTQPKPGRKHFPAMSVLLQLVDNLGREFGMDPDRLYVTGQEMGGFGTFNALKSDPNMWAAAVVVSGGGDPNSAASFAHVPVWIYTGEKSPIIHYPRDMFVALKAASGHPKLTVLNGAATACWAEVYESQSVWDWLFSQRRQPRLPTTQPAPQPGGQAGTQPGTRPAAPEPPKPVIIYGENGQTKEYRPGEK